MKSVFMKTVTDLDLTNFNSYRLKATCKRAFFPDSEADIQEIYEKYGDSRKIILGSGHNIILAKEYYEDDFIIFSGNFSHAVIDGNLLSVESGISMYDLSILALDNELSGLELFYDIPSSLGGAVVMNAGASGEEIKDLLVKVRYYDPLENTFSEILKEDINFEYRNSFFQRNPKDKMERNKEVRWSKQPKDFPNAGSVFKRPPGFFVGALMDELQLKGYTVGGAKISEKHGGFIVNFNNATGEDILAVIKHAQKMVKDRHGVELEVEQRII
jgi:UDP-N-acetylmuramate dehydrogenase